MIVALGSFDGFHKAHQQLLDTAKKRALSLGVDWGIVTFDGHPQSLFTGKCVSSSFY
jgi:FAD synthase